MSKLLEDISAKIYLKKQLNIVNKMENKL